MRIRSATGLWGFATFANLMMPKKGSRFFYKEKGAMTKPFCSQGPGRPGEQSIEELETFPFCVVLWFIRIIRCQSSRTTPSRPMPRGRSLTYTHYLAGSRSCSMRLPCGGHQPTTQLPILLILLVYIHAQQHVRRGYTPLLMLAVRLCVCTSWLRGITPRVL